MEKVSFLTFAGLLCVIVASGIFRSSRVNSSSLYLLADKKTTLFPLVATLVMTEFNTATLISFSAAGYFAHWWALLLPLVFLIGLSFYALTVANKWNHFQGLSVRHFFSEKYGKDVGILVGVILFVAMAGFSAAYIKALTLIFIPLFPQTNTWFISALLVFIAILMTSRGGLIAIIRTDIFSFIIVLIFFPLLLFYAAKLPTLNVVNIPMNIEDMQQLLPSKFIGSLVLLTMFSYILAPWYSQKVTSACSPHIAKKAVIIASIIIYLLYAAGVLATCQLAKKGVILTNAEQALPYLIKNGLPAILSGIGYCVLYLAGATTLSGVWSAMVTFIVREKGFQSEQAHLRESIILTIGCAFITYLLANLFVDHVFNKMILANIPVVALSFGLLAGFYWKKVTKNGVYVSILVGLIWGTGCYLYYGDKNMYTWYWAIYGIPLIFISGTIVSLLKKSGIDKQ